MTVTKRVFYFLRGVSDMLRRKHFQNAFILVISFFLLTGFVFNAYATTDNWGYDIKETYSIIDNLSTDSTDTAGKHSHKSQGFQVADSLGTLLDVVVPQANVRYAQILENENIPMSAKLGVLGTADVAVTALLYNPPNYNVPNHLASEWVPNYKEGVGSVYAVSGYEQLQQVGMGSLWSITRNLAYICFVIVFIVAGFMIMFRHKLGGQTMVTIYNTLPNVVLGLVLVTFSFAIVGVMIDIGVVLQNALLALVKPSDSGFINPTNPLGVWAGFLRDGVLLDQGSEGFWNIENITKRLLTGGILKAFTGNSLGDLMLLLVASLIVFFAAMKIFMTLIKAYLGLLVDTVIGPIVLAIGTIPGRNGMIKDWFNRVLKNVMVFVLVFVIVQLPLFLMENLGVNINAWDMFGAGLGEPRTALASATDESRSRLVFAAITIYFLFLAANVPKMLEDFFPQTGGKGMMGAQAGVKEGVQKVPGIGGFFK